MGLWEMFQPSHMYTNIKQCYRLTCPLQSVSLCMVSGWRAAARHSTGSVCPSGRPLVRHTCAYEWTCVQTCLSGFCNVLKLQVCASMFMCVIVCMCLCVRPKSGPLAAEWGEQSVSGTSTKEYQLYTQSQVRSTVWSTVAVSLGLRFIGLSFKSIKISLSIHSFLYKTSDLSKWSWRQV